MWDLDIESDSKKRESKGNQEQKLQALTSEVEVLRRELYYGKVEDYNSAIKKVVDYKYALKDMLKNVVSQDEMKRINNVLKEAEECKKDNELEIVNRILKNKEIKENKQTTGKREYSQVKSVVTLVRIEKLRQRLFDGRDKRRQALDSCLVPMSLSNCITQNDKHDNDYWKIKNQNDDTNYLKRKKEDEEYWERKRQQEKEVEEKKYWDRKYEERREDERRADERREEERREEERREEERREERRREEQRLEEQRREEERRAEEKRREEENYRNALRKLESRDEYTASSYYN